MATRGTAKDRKNTDNLDGICLSPNTVTGELTCSICFEVFESPRTLPTCLHTFCEECLFKVFDRASRDLDPVYLCPVCRKSVGRPGYGVFIKDWVRELPVNHVINSLLTSYKKKQEANLQAPKGISSEQCSSCDALETTEFCFDCHDFMCQKCIDLHNHFKATRHHKTVSVSGMENLEKQVIEMSKCTICPVHHDKKLEFYCKTDKSPLCSVCAHVDHRKCGDIITIESLIRESESTEKVKTIVNKLNDIKPKLKSHEIMLLKNKESVKEDLRKVIKTVSDSTNKAIIKLHKLEKKTIENCNALEKQITESVNETIQSCKTLEPNIGELVAKLDVALKFGSDLQVFLAMDEMKTEVDSVFQLVAEKHGVAKTYEMQFKEASVLSKLMSASTIGEASKETMTTEIKPLAKEEKLENPEPASLKPATKAAVSLFSNCIGTDHGPLIQPATKNRKMDNVNVKQAGGRGMCSTFTLSSPGVPSSNATCTTSTSVAPETLPFGYFNVAATSKPIFTMDTNTGTFALGSVTNKMLAPVSSLPTSAFDTLSTGIPTGTFNRSSGYSAGSIPTTLFSFNPPVIGGIPTDFKLPEFGGLASNSRPSVFGGLALNSKSPVFGWLTSNSNQPVFGGYTSNSNPPVFRGMATIGTNSFSITAAGNSSLAMTNQSSATADHRMASVNTSFDDAGNSGTNNSTAAANIIIFSTSDAEKNGTNKLPATTEKTLSTNITTSIGASKPSSSADQTWVFGPRSAAVSKTFPTNISAGGANRSRINKLFETADSKTFSTNIAAGGADNWGINKLFATANSKSFLTNISACAADNCGGTKPSSTADNKALSTKISANGVGSSGGYISSIVSTSSVLTFSSFVSRDLSTIGTNTFSVAATTAFKEGSSSMESVSKSRKTSRKKLLEKSYKKKQESEGEQVRFCQSNTVRNGFDFSLSSSALGQQDNTNTPMVPNFSFGLPDTSSSTVPISNLACTSTAHVHVSEQTLTSANLQTLSKTARMDESQSAVRESSAGISPNCSNTAVAGSEVISLPSTQPVSWKVSTQAISHPTVSDTKHMNGEYTASAFVPYIPRSELSSVKPNPVGMPSSAAELISPESSKCNTLANSFAKANHTSNSQVDSATVGKVKNVRKVLKKVKRLQHSVLNKHEQPFSPLSASYNDAFPPLTSSVSAFQSVTAGECSIRPISAAEGTDISNSPAVPSYSGSTNMYASLGSVAACIPTDSGVVKDCCTKSGGQVSLTANVTSSGTLSVTSKGSLAATTWSLQTLRLSSTQITTTTTPSATLSHTLTLAAASPDSDVKEGGARATQTTPIKGTSKGLSDRRAERFTGQVKYSTLPWTPLSPTLAIRCDGWRAGSLVFTRPDLEKKWKLEIYLDIMNYMAALTIHAKISGERLQDHCSSASEMFAACDLKVGRCRQLIEFMKFQLRDIQCLTYTDAGLLLKVYQPNQSEIRKFILNFKPDSQAKLKALVREITHPPSGGGDNAAAALPPPTPAFTTTIPTNFSFTGTHSPFTFGDNHSTGNGDGNHGN